MSHFLDNYRQLTARVDALCTSIAANLGKQITAYLPDRNAGTLKFRLKFRVVLVGDKKNACQDGG